ncbi:MAG: hypothetical protein MR210_01065 [Erysipelotrichaceae bacterium]|nr:hypothetical protein [Erysipelotrichaceae bacterium]MDY5252285.1 hypothetical protein [Erysipelotrichaceae bacterium]
MKKIILFLLVLCLSGCQSQLDIQQALDSNLAKANALPSAVANNNKKFYSFYLEPDIGRLQANQTSSILKYKDTKFTMNLNISKIVNAQSYGDIIPDITKPDDQYLVAQSIGNYTDYDGTSYPYQSYIYHLPNGDYYLTMDTQYVFFSAIGNEYQVLEVADQMLKIAKSVSIDDEEIMIAYSAKERIIFEGEELSLYDQIIPVEGKVSDMLEKPTDITGGDNIDEGNILPKPEENEEENLEDDGEYRTDSFE